MANVFQPTSCIMITFCIRYILVSPAGVALCSFIQLSAKHRTKNLYVFGVCWRAPELNQICLSVLEV